MADDDQSAMSFNIRDLHTRSVTIFPQNAQVIRVLEDIDLKPGPNRIEIVGLSPTVDEGSIKVDGHGQASISGVTVESIRNPEHFQDVYDSDSDDDLDKPEPRRLPDKPEKLQKLEAQVRKMKADVTLLDEKIMTIRNGMQGLQQLTATVGKENLSADEITQRVEKFEQTSRRQAQQIQFAQEQKVPLLEELPKLTLEMEAAYRAYQRDTKPQRKEMERAEAKWQRTRTARQKARQERFAERANFWPRNVYKISVAVERLEDTSGRSDATAVAAPERVSLSIYYVTSEASWTPAYDVNIESESQSGTLIYRAEISNKTSETWRDTQVTLSTSQTSFKGLRDPIPELRAWHVRLQRGKGALDQPALMSSQERASKSAAPWNRPPAFKRAMNFGVPNEANPHLQHNTFASWDGSSLANSGALSAPPPPAPPQAAAANPFGGGNQSSLFGTALRPAAGFSNAPGAPPPTSAPTATANPFGGGNQRSLFGAAPRSAASFGNAPGAPPPLGAVVATDGLSEGLSVMTDEDADTLQKKESAASFKPISIPEAAWEESGLTAAWDLSGVRSISPSSNRHRHRIAMIGLSDLELKHVCVPKLRTDAFLTMRLRNPSDQTILPGEAGLTLDGAFLGTTSLRRVAPGESTTVSLGVDEGIVVEYAKPVEKRNLTSGLINKDASTGFQRCVTLRHTKAAEGSAQPVEITVRDQIPLVMDERIRLELAKPCGLRGVGDKVGAGEEVKDEATASDRPSGRSSVSSAPVARPGTSRDAAWGRATAELNKDGKIEWKVKLNPGQKVALLLDYELKFPAGESLAVD